MSIGRSRPPPPPCENCDKSLLERLWELLDAPPPPWYQPSRLNRADPDNPSKARAFFSAAQFASLGLEMGLCIAIGVGFGYWLDTKAGTAPWLLIFFLFCGIAAAGKAVYDAARRAQRSEPASNHQTDGEHGTKGTQAD